MVSFTAQVLVTKCLMMKDVICSLEISLASLTDFIVSFPSICFQTKCAATES